MSSRKLIVRNLNSDITEDELCDELGADDALIITNQSGVSKGYVC